MDTREREILERNQGLLLSNIIHCEEFYYQMKKENVLPDTMIRDIQCCASQEDRNRKLLHNLMLRGGDSYRRFRHVLYLTGHLFLADQLYGEDYEYRVLRAEDIFGKFPKVFKHVSDDVKSKFLRHMESKLKETTLRSAWLKSSSDRNDFLDVKKANFETEKEYRFKVESKKKKISLLQDEIIHLREKIKKGDSEKLIVQKEIAEMKMGFKEELAKQSRFNAANNNSVIQLRDRFDQFNERVKALNVSLREFFTGSRDWEHEEDPDDVKLSSLERNIRRLVQVAKSNIDKTSNNMNEKEVVLSMLKTSSRHQQETLSEVVRHYVDKQEKGKASLSRELDGLLDTVRGTKYTAKFTARPRTDMKLIKTQVATLKEEVEHIKKKLDWKNTQITDLIQENTLIREQLAGSMQRNTGAVTLPRIPDSPRTRDLTGDSPDSAQEIENVYQQFDRYMHESYVPPATAPRMRRRGSLAEVNLEQDISPPTSTRDSKVQNIDVVDILDVGGINDTRTTDVSIEQLSDRSRSLPNILDRSYTTPRQKISLPYVYPDRKTQYTPRDSRLEAINENEVQHVLDDVTNTSETNRGIPERKREEFVIPDFKMQGRRPSLAELIMIHDDSQKYQQQYKEEE